MKSILIATMMFALGSSCGVTLAGPCNTPGKAAQDAGSGPVTVGSSRTENQGQAAKEHPPTGAMNRASGDAAASSQDAQRQMQGQPTAAEQAQGKETRQNGDGC